MQLKNKMCVSPTCAWVCVCAQCVDKCNVQAGTATEHRSKFYLVDRAHSDPTATAYLAPPHPTYLKAAGKGLLLSSR